MRSFFDRPQGGAHLRPLCQRHREPPGHPDREVRRVGHTDRGREVSIPGVESR